MLTRKIRWLCLSYLLIWDHARHIPYVWLRPPCDTRVTPSRLRHKYLRPHQFSHRSRHMGPSHGPGSVIRNSQSWPHPTCHTIYRVQSVQSEWWAMSEGTTCNTSTLTIEWGLRSMLGDESSAKATFHPEQQESIKKLFFLQFLMTIFGKLYRKSLSGQVGVIL